MKRRDFHYDLPPERIAQYPPPARGDARLLVLDGATGELRDRRIGDVLELVSARDLLVFNDTRVIPARIHGRKRSGGRVEVLIERITGETSARAHIRASKPPKSGTGIVLDGGHRLTVTGRTAEGLYEIASEPGDPLSVILNEVGHVPLPPYIERADERLDTERYQTIYARVPGAVAAPTAGLHFDAALLAALAARGVESAFVTLHVGAGTFQPVRCEAVEAHRMHAEYLEVSSEVCARVAATRAAGGRVIAIGTTSVRALETAAAGGTLAPYRGDTRLFIYPGYRFRAVDALLTNFHLPESTLLMLVAAFAGHAALMRAYRHAVAAGYRFFSYGDAMWVTPQAGALAEGRDSCADRLARP